MRVNRYYNLRARDYHNKFLPLDLIILSHRLSLCLWLAEGPGTISFTSPLLRRFRFGVSPIFSEQ